MPDPQRPPDEPGVTAEDAAGFAGTPDCFERLWTPHRMAYIGGENKPAGPASAECPFCAAPQRPDDEALVIARGTTCFAVLNLYPYNPGHLLICPYRHVAAYPDLDRQERDELGFMTAVAMKALEAASGPGGYNLGMNQGQTGGAGVAAHLHQHVVPRWVGDANFLPIIGRTKALPQLLGETRSLLASAWPEASRLVSQAQGASPQEAS